MSGELWLGLALLAFGLWQLWQHRRVSRLMEAAARRPARSSAGAKLPPGTLEQFLSTHRAALDATNRPVWRIALTPLAQDDVFTSKVGGRAYWPEHAALTYPSSPDEKPLALLAQIRLDELPPTVAQALGAKSPIGPTWPTQGLLQFFIANNDLLGANFESPTAQTHFRVIHWPQLEACGATPDVAAEFGSDTNMLPMQSSGALRMRFEAGTETVGPAAHGFAKALGGDLFASIRSWAQAHGVDADDLGEALFDTTERGGHRLGGHPHFTQDDPRSGDTENWHLLFQLDSDEHLLWGDCGVANFFIADSALARGDFSQVLYNWDCH